MKKFSILLSLALAVSLLAGVQVSAKSAAASVTLNGTALSADALIEDGSVYLPVRAAGEALGYQAAYARKNGAQTVTLQNGGAVVLDLTNQRITEGVHQYYAYVPNSAFDSIQLTGGRTYLAAPLFDRLFGLHTVYDAAKNQVSATTVPQNEISVNTHRTESQDEVLKLTLQYPYLTGMSDEKVQDAINLVFEKAAAAARAEGEKNAADMRQSIADGYTGTTACETNFDYAVQYNQNGLLSITTEDYQYAGGAHGSTVQSSYTFDLATGKALTLADLMNSSSGYAAYINRQIRAEIDRRVAAGNLYEFEQGKFTDIGANPDYYLSNDGVVLYFQQYEYFPYAAGIQEFTIPYADLTTMLKPEFVFLSASPATLGDTGTTRLTVGQVGSLELLGNPTTGYAWQCESSDPSVLAPAGSLYTASPSDGRVGTGGTYRFDFKALKAGTATVTCRYYRSWEGQQTALRTVTYQVSVA